MIVSLEKMLDRGEKISILIKKSDSMVKILFLEFQNLPYKIGYYV